MTTQFTPNFGIALPDFRSGPWHDLVNGDFTKIDALLFSALSGANVAVWQHNTAYTTGTNTLDDTDATIWLCVVNHTSAVSGTFAADRTAHPTYWTRLLTGFAPRGEWAQNTQYFPYDLTYDSGRGIMALCSIKHTSTSTGSIITDEAYWEFLLDMSDIGTIIAGAVTYSNTASGLTASNVQTAIDETETQIKALNNVNVTQGNQITAIQNLNTTQDSRLGALETKTTGVISAPHFVATDNVSTQIGGSAAVGLYMDTVNLALRPPGTGTIYFQSQGGGATYGTWNSSGLSVTGTFNVSGAMGASSLTGGNVHVTGGGIYMGGWGGDGNTSVIFLNTANNHYLYHDGSGNVTFSGCNSVNANNGRLWGSNDFSTPVSNGRLVYGGDPGLTTGAISSGNWIVENWGGAVLTGWMMNATPGEFGTAYALVGFRIRYMQLYTSNWFTIGYA